ncbi:MAG: DUF1501 domain-containing protein [Planctomycetes bacterium]|nr:DUF1501 domain-containing protein [Planctomycetota bacterium]
MTNGTGRLSRRRFMQTGLAASGGLLIPGLPALALRGRFEQEAQAQSIIQIFLGGGLSHIDSFDPKPTQPIEIRGEYRAVPTKVDDLLFSEHLRRTAAIADRLVVIRSFGHGEAAHERGFHTMLTGYQPSPAIAYPSYGSVVSHELGSRRNLPAYIAIPNAGYTDMGPGYLSSAHAPFSVGSDPASRSFKVRDLDLPKGVDEDRMRLRRSLLDEMDARFERSRTGDALQAKSAFYEQAFQLIHSPEARDAFDLEKEDGKTRDTYGRTRLGQRLLLARRLVESGTRFITVTEGGFDHHARIFTGLRTPLDELDRAFSTLITDLDRRGLLDRTLVLITSEFGRTPQVNTDGGRDHWPKVFTVVAAGGGLKRGLAYGTSNARGSEPEENPVRPADLAATLFAQLGIDPTRKILSPGDRPIDIVRGGTVLDAIIAKKTDLRATDPTSAGE